MRNHKTIHWVVVLFILVLAFSTLGFADDDIEFTPGEDSGFYYTIKNGDTLWDLSQKFYNSQWDWPGLWELNDDIKNPHWIYPGNKIRIFLKDKSKRKPIVVEAQKDKKIDVPVNISTSFSFSEMDHVGFLKKEAETSFGSVIREQDGNHMMSKNDIIYIKPSGKGTFIPGKAYHIFTTSKLTQKIDEEIFTGVKHLIKAQIEILENNASYTKALITHAYYDVNHNDLVMPYYKREKTLIVDERPDPIDARVICSEDNNVMINDYRVAFIDIGKTKVVPGQIYTVMRKNVVKDNSLWVSKKKKEETIDLENLESGKLIVLHTEDIASTVMILSSKYAIHPDDMVN